MSDPSVVAKTILPTPVPRVEGRGAGRGAEFSLDPLDPKDFRNHLATADQKGKRKWVYAKKPQGKLYSLRSIVSVALLAIMFAGPFIKINGNPLLLLNIVQRKFVILGHIFWPQDVAIFAVAMLLFITSIIIFTAAFGRLWCGWTCPQTLLMEMVFRRIEYWIEGDNHAQRAAAKNPTPKTIAKKTLKHAVFVLMSFIIGNTLLSYIIGIEQLKVIVTDNPANHLQGLGFMILFTGIFYLNFARFREQACAYICPYGRFQSALLDENTMLVIYDYRRGEGRKHLKKGETFDQRHQQGLGDCIDCRSCVTVCPAGIDIRNGTQMECVNCTACIDACNDISDKIGRPRQLIRWASQNAVEKGEKFRFTPRMGIYAAVVTVLAAVLAILVFTRSDVEATFLRAPGAMFQQLPGGKIENLYTVQLINKTSRDMVADIKLLSGSGELQVMGVSPVRVPKENLAETSVLIQLPAGALHDGKKDLKVGIFSKGKLIQTVNTSFVGPRDTH
ncbi:MAG: cytochrome oxidase [Verrucomicrobiales bacterium]|nr:cytochrome oxidase [Verrucomicrobiales bacterium]